MTSCHEDIIRHPNVTRITHQHIYTKQELQILMKNTPYNEQCCICQDTQNDEEYVVFECGHAHHFICINLWLQQTNTCPICTRPVICKNRKDGLESITTKLSLLHLYHDDKTFCAICANQFDIPEAPYIKLICGHVYHSDCFELWSSTRCVCPLDNKTIYYLECDVHV